MEEGRLLKEVMKWSPPGRRKRGRSKATWAEGIRGLLGGKGINPLVLELDLYSLAHHLCKMCIFYEPRRVTLGNTRQFVEE